MSTERQNEVVAIGREKGQVREPGKWAVTFWNDDYTTMDFVIEMLEKYFDHDLETAAILMMDVHTKGSAIAGIYPHDIAETKMVQVLNEARAKEHPLWVTIVEV